MADVLYIIWLPALSSGPTLDMYKRRLSLGLDMLTNILQLQYDNVHTLQFIY